MADPSHRPATDPAAPDPRPAGDRGREGERPGEGGAERPADHHPPTARTPEEYTETPGSHRDADGAATDVGA